MTRKKILHLKGKDLSGRVAEYYLHVNNIQYILLQKVCTRAQILDISKFGTILYSAYD